MISGTIQKLAVLACQRTGKPIREVLQSLVNAMRGPKIPFSEDLKCWVCGWDKLPVMRTDTDGIITTRIQRCSFCGWTVHTIENSSQVARVNPEKPRENPEVATKFQKPCKVKVGKKNRKR